MRQTSAEVDHKILDVAAALFAQHGFQHASVQRIADAVGYSKAGLLHRFGTKEAIHRAVRAEVDETVAEIEDRSASLPPVELLELLARRATRRPGMARLALIESDRLVTAMLDGTRDTPTSRLRARLALELVVDAATDPPPELTSEEVLPLAARLALAVLRDPAQVPHQENRSTH